MGWNFSEIKVGETKFEAKISGRRVKKKRSNWGGMVVQRLLKKSTASKLIILKFLWKTTAKKFFYYFSFFSFYTRISKQNIINNPSYRNSDVVLRLGYILVHPCLFMKFCVILRTSQHTFIYFSFFFRNAPLSNL